METRICILLLSLVALECSGCALFHRQAKPSTDDSAQALSYLKRFGSVTVLNGHIHQTMRKVEGNITFHTALSTAFPQPAPGTPGASPGPIAVPAGQLRTLLGITDVNFVSGQQALAVTDSTLAEMESPMMHPMGSQQ